MFLCFFSTQSSMTFFQLRVIVTEKFSPSCNLMCILSFRNVISEMGVIGFLMLLNLSISCVFMLLYIWLCLIATYFKLNDTLSSVRQVNIRTKRSSMLQRSLSMRGRIYFSALLTAYFWRPIGLTCTDIFFSDHYLKSSTTCLTTCVIIYFACLKRYQRLQD